MQYRWDEFTLDREGALLTCQGQQIDVSRKILDCISHLIEHRDRVVSYDELIRKVWGHDNVTNHQLSQVILATRRALGDDGQAQRLIRTMPGLGYRWVLEVIEGSSAPSPSPPISLADTAVDTPSAGTHSTAPSQEADHRAGHSARRRLGKPIAFLFGAIAMVVVSSHVSHTKSRTKADAVLAPANPITELKSALIMGRYEHVREQLAVLPAELQNSPDVMLLDIELDIHRGRFARAGEKLARQLARADAATNTVLHARLLVQQSNLNNRLQLSGSEVLLPAQSAVVLLESAGDQVPTDILAEALWSRANGYILSDRFDQAQLDLTHARDLYNSLGDMHRMAVVRGSLARVWMRSGRLSEALEEMRQVADSYGSFGDNIREIFARNTMTKIQIELLRWDDALASSDRSMRLLREVPDSERRYPTLQLRALALTGLGRLREAGSLLDEADGPKSERTDFIIPAIYHLEAGDLQAALKAAAQEFNSTSIDTSSNLLLENKDGALLLWMTAAQAMTAAGSAMPIPSKEQLKILQAPAAPSGGIARGRWLWSQGHLQEAEAALRQALAETQRLNQPYRMTLACEALIELLLQQDRTGAAEAVAKDLRAFNPNYMDRDYRTNLLRLRVALAAGDNAMIRTAYQNTRALAGERKLPAGVTLRLAALNLDSARRISRN